MNDPPLYLERLAEQRSGLLDIAGGKSMPHCGAADPRTAGCIYDFNALGLPEFDIVLTRHPAPVAPEGVVVTDHHKTNTMTVAKSPYPLPGRKGSEFRSEPAYLDLKAKRTEYAVATDGRHHQARSPLGAKRLQRVAVKRDDHRPEPARFRLAPQYRQHKTMTRMDSVKRAHRSGSRYLRLCS